ncbi:hypothetical protein KP509_37G006600 [Ceratopteris richardii]|uniref:SWIM-type domain-containing protein n=1 Tax=Ceratopteris richardii TaxID=49495 RepID=A0A8T2Q771_CERRI|nr:hypothetical protein KP509_37G006600 [Ceratopteris richardii]
MTEPQGAAKMFSSPAEVKALVPEFVFKRAMEVISSNKLHEISFQGPFLQNSTAACTGSNPGDSYTLSVSVNAASSSSPICQCSCPAALKAKGNLCKHVVALLLLRSKELTKVASNEGDAASLPDFQVGGNRSIENWHTKSTSSDSQATEVIPPDKDEPDSPVMTSSVSSVVKNNQKRVLPSWVSEGQLTLKREVKEKKSKEKCTNMQDRFVKEGGEINIQNGNNATKSERSNQRKLASKDAIRKPLVKRWKDGKTGRLHDECSVHEGDHGCESKELAMLDAQGNLGTSSRKNSRPATSNTRKRMDVESDLSEEDEAEVLNPDYSSKDKESVALTSEDLIRFATEHLENEKQVKGPEEDESYHNIGTNPPEQHINVPKKKPSIFSVQEWNSVANNGFDIKSSFTQDSSKALHGPSIGGFNETYSQGSAECGSELATACGASVKAPDSLRDADDVVDDMLGIFFGPSLVKTANPKSEFSQQTVQDVIIEPALVHENMADPVVPVYSDSVPQSKKKSSLKDKVKIYLG